MDEAQKAAVAELFGLYVGAARTAVYEMSGNQERDLKDLLEEVESLMKKFPDMPDMPVVASLREQVARYEEDER